MNNYRQSPVVMARGEGCALFDVEGRRYLDMTAQALHAPRSYIDGVLPPR